MFLTASGAEIDERERQLVAYLLVHDMRDADAVRLGQGFEPRGDIDPIAVDVVGFGDDVAKIDANAEPHALRFGDRLVAVMHAALHLDRAEHGFDHAWKFRQEPVPGIFDDTAVMLLDHGIDEFAPTRHQTVVGSFLVALHQTRVARYIGEEDRGEPPG